MKDIFFGANPNAMWIYEPDSLRIKAVNEAATVLYGYSREEMLSLKIKDLRPESEVPKLQKEVEKNNQEFNDAGIWFHKKKNGGLIYVHILSYPIEWEGDYCKVVVAQDVTEQKDIEQEYRRAKFKEEQHRLLLNGILSQAESVVTVKDQHGRYQLVNKKFCEILDLKEEQILGKTEDEIYGSSGCRVIRKADENIQQNENIVETEEVLETPEGEQTFVAVRYPLKNVPGYEKSICSIATEITDLKQAREKLENLYQKEKKERLRIERIKKRRELLEQVNDLFVEEHADHLSSVKKVAKLLLKEVADICAFDIFVEGKLKRMVQAMEISPEKAKVVKEIREKYPEWFHNSDILTRVTTTGKPLLEKKITAADLKKQVENSEQLDLVKKLEIRSYFILPLKVKDDILGAITLLITESDHVFSDDDISFLKELAAKTALHIENSLINKELVELNQTLEEKVKERTQQLENINEELESFSYSVSHDLRTPLRAISGYTSLLLEDYRDQVDGEGQEFLQIIHGETKRMGELIDDLLSFSRLSRKEKVRRSFAMQPLVDECIEEVKKSFPDADPQIKTGDLPEVYGDPKLLRQVWINLLGNAVKYSKNGNPQIVIDCQKEQEEYLTFYVKDNGVGFNMKYADKLFGVFQRLHSDDEFEGTGIGLALVRRIVNRHEGEVWAESEVGKGSTFYFSLPEL